MKRKLIIYNITNSKTFIKHWKHSFWIVQRNVVELQMQSLCSQTEQFDCDTDSMSSDNLLCLIWNKYSVHVGMHVYLIVPPPPPPPPPHTLTHTIRLRTEAAESTRMFVCIEGLVKLNGRGGALFLLLVEGWLVGCWRREHAWVAPGDKQTFIPAVSCLLDLRGATDSSWIHLALVKHVQR